MMRRIVIFKVSFVTLAALITVGSVCATAQERSQVPPKTTELGDWLLGEWIGIREGTWGRRETTIRITSYDQATNAFKGDGYVVVPNADIMSLSHTIDLVIKSVIDEEGKVVMTTDHSGGRSFTFNLKRTRDGHLSGTTSYGLPRLTLEKKH